MKYERVGGTGWKGVPNTDTPISAENLNIMDKGIEDAAKAIGDEDISEVGENITKAIKNLYEDTPSSLQIFETEDDWNALTPEEKENIDEAAVYKDEDDELIDASDIGYRDRSVEAEPDDINNDIDNINTNLYSNIRTTTLALGTKSFSANSPMEISVDISSIEGAVCVLDLVYNAPTVGAQHITHRRYGNSNTYRVMSTVAQNCQLSALVLKYNI